MSERAPLLPATEARGIKHTRVQVEDVGVTVSIRNSPYAYSNHFIIQSRPYFRRPLPTYIDCALFLCFTRLMFLASFLGALALKGGYFKGAPFYCFLVCAFFIGIFCQHEVVNRKSLKTVLTQPVIDGQRSLNSLYEVTITELQGMALQNYRAGIGFIHVSEGKVKFQAFNRRAVRGMMSARQTSRCMLFLFFCAACYNFYFMMVHSLGFKFWGYLTQWNRYKMAAGYFALFAKIPWHCVMFHGMTCERRRICGCHWRKYICVRFVCYRYLRGGGVCTPCTLHLDPPLGTGTRKVLEIRVIF